MLSCCSLHFPTFLYNTKVVKGISRRFLSKTRTIIDPSLEVSPPTVLKLNPFNKIRVIAKKSYLPISHISKALCTREGKFYYLKVRLKGEDERQDEEGRQHCFKDERDIVIPYPIAERYLHECKKSCECVEIDPENISTESVESKRVSVDRVL